MEWRGKERSGCRAQGGKDGGSRSRGVVLWAGGRELVGEGPPPKALELGWSPAGGAWGGEREGEGSRCPSETKEFTYTNHYGDKALCAKDDK